MMTLYGLKQNKQNKQQVLVLISRLHNYYNLFENLMNRKVEPLNIT